MEEPIFAEVPEDIAALSDDDLAALIEDYEQTRADVTANPQSFVSAEVTVDALLQMTSTAVNETLPALRAEQTRRQDIPAETASQFAELANDPEPEAETVEETAAVEEAEDTVVAGGTPVRRRLPAPPESHEMAELDVNGRHAVSLVAAGGARDIPIGTPFRSEMELAEAICERARHFGDTTSGVVERYAVARADWRDEYPADRRLNGMDEVGNAAIISPLTNQATIKQALRDRIAQAEKDLSLVASGGLCAPVTPYYNLQFISVPTRPVMASLPSFMADRGGLRYARPAALSAVTTGVGLITESEDAAGGTSATKSCQVIPCPEFQETDVDIIYHCLQFGNLGARAFPELVAQWNNLVLAAHARLAESNLLTQIDAFSTQVTAGSLGLGASATLFSQILTAANGLRSRNRMDPEAVLRLLIPWWAVDLIVSDVIRTQFQRFDTDQAAVTALLRSFNIEPTFYIDSANGRGQVYGTQADGALDPFPSSVVWYLFPEASFLYLDGGMLELGIVRDSILNKTNDFQLFGETFENVAYVGVESLAVESIVCDSGTVSLPASVTCPIDYSGSY